MAKNSLLVAQTLRVLVDLVLLVTSLGLAFALRFDWSIPEDMLARMTVVTPYAVALQYGGLALFRAPRASWRFFSLRDARPFVYAFAISSLALISLRYGVPFIFEDSAVASQIVVPLSIIFLDAGIAFVFTVSARALRRAISEDVEHHARVVRSAPPPRKARTLLIGAGEAGVVIAQELRRRPDLGIVAVGFVDDEDQTIQRKGTTICGIPVLGHTSELKQIASQSGAEEALIAVANARGPSIRRLTALCEAAGLGIRIVPGIHEIVGGTVNLSAIREVAIEDLLGRAPVQSDEAELLDAFRRAHVLVTGAGGSIGSELCRQILRFGPARLLLLDSAEANLFHIHRELQAKAETVELVPLVASVTDETSMRSLFHKYRPEIVFHAAAYKHVPMMELNPAQAVINNTLGTRLTADLADEFQAREFVLVSTDKAVRPSSIMGASKRAAEIYVQALGAHSATRFITVRFGNVLGSTGSVIPIFKEQIANGGPVTVTDPRMTRYFMTIPEACQLIVQAARLGRGGEIFMLDMGEPVKIMDVARDLISLSGFTPGVDVEIVITGIRPGEKLSEELWAAEEGVTSTTHPSIFVGNSPARSLQEVSAWFSRLNSWRDRGDSSWVRPALRDLIPEATFAEEIASVSETEPVGRELPTPGDLILEI